VIRIESILSIFFDVEKIAMLGHHLHLVESLFAFFGLVLFLLRLILTYFRCCGFLTA
jgi:hypothetical protein